MTTGEGSTLHRMYMFASHSRVLSVGTFRPRWFTMPREDGIVCVLCVYGTT